MRSMEIGFPAALLLRRHIQPDNSSALGTATTRAEKAVRPYRYSFSNPNKIPVESLYLWAALAMKIFGLLHVGDLNDSHQLLVYLRRWLELTYRTPICCARVLTVPAHLRT